MPNEIKIDGPPRRAKPDNVATPYELPLNQRPSNAWIAHFQSIDWKALGAQRPAVFDPNHNVILVAWLTNEQSMFQMLDAVKAAVAAINERVAAEESVREREEAEAKRKEEEAEEARQALLDRWWRERGGDS